MAYKERQLLSAAQSCGVVKICCSATNRSKTAYNYCPKLFILHHFEQEMVDELGISAAALEIKGESANQVSKMIAPDSLRTLLL